VAELTDGGSGSTADILPQIYPSSALGCKRVVQSVFSRSLHSERQLLSPAAVHPIHALTAQFGYKQK
jgi:hypothetical protein